MADVRKPLPGLDEPLVIEGPQAMPGTVDFVRLFEQYAVPMQDYNDYCYSASAEPPAVLLSNANVDSK